MRRTLTPLIVLVGLIAAPVVAQGHGGRDGGHGQGHSGNGADEAVTFAGSCQLAGVVSFEPPLTTVPQEVRAAARAEGTCSGTLTDADGGSRELDGAFTRYRARAVGQESCGAATAEGAGSLKLGGERIGFALTETRVGQPGILTLEGDAGGSATATASASGDEDPIAIAQKCAADGLDRVRIDISLASPGISG
jgi:hypothetical protein